MNVETYPRGCNFQDNSLSVHNLERCVFCNCSPRCVYLINSSSVSVFHLVLDVVDLIREDLRS